jgi:hypothetical protein
MADGTSRGGNFGVEGLVKCGKEFLRTINPHATIAEAAGKLRIEVFCGAVDVEVRNLRPNDYRTLARCNQTAWSDPDSRVTQHRR